MKLVHFTLLFHLSLLMGCVSVSAIPGGGLLWSSLNTTAISKGNNSTATFTSGPTYNANHTSAFIGSAAGLIAFDLADGKASWLNPGVKLAPTSRPVVGRELVFASLASGNLTAYDGATGKVVWTFPVPGVGGSTPVLSPSEEMIFIGSYALQTKDGTLMWSLPSTGPAANVTGNPSLHPDGLVVFVGDEEGGLLAINAKKGKVIWAVAAYGAIRGTPVVSSDGRAVFAQSADGVLYCLSTMEGALLWSYKYGKGLLAGDLSPVVTSSGDFAVLVGGGGELLGLDALDGTLLWNTTAPGGAVIMTPTLGKSFSRNIVYVGAADGTVSALDVRSGEVLWMLPMLGQLVGPAAAPITSDGTTLTYATADQGLLAIATDLGREMWAYGANNNAATATAAVAEGGKVAIVPTNRGLARVDMITGIEYWLLPLDVSFSPLISHDGAIAYVLTVKDKALRAVRVDDGKVLWRVSNMTEPAFSAPPALSPDGNTIVVALHGKIETKLRAHSTHQGEFLWETPLELGIVSAPLIKTVGGKDTLFFGSLDKKVHALAMKDGAPLWTFETGGWVTSTPTLSHDSKTLYVGSEDHFMYALSSADGTVMWAERGGEGEQKEGGGIFTQPALSSTGDLLVYSTRAGTITALKTKAKTDADRVLWRVPTHTPLSACVFSPADLTVYVGTEVGELLALDTQTGMLNWAYEAVGPFSTPPLVVQPQGEKVLATTANGLLVAIRALPAGHERGHNEHEGIRGEDKEENGKVRRHRLHRRGLNKQQAKIAAIFLMCFSTLFILALGVYFTSKRLATKNAGQPYVVRMADLAQGQRPRGSVPLDEPDKELRAPQREVEMEVI